MRPGTLAGLIAGIVALFALVWGGVWYLHTEGQRKDVAAKAQAVQEASDKAEAQRQAEARKRQEEAAEREHAAKQQAADDRKAQAKADRQAEIDKAHKAAADKAERVRQTRIQLLSERDRRVYELFKEKLRTKSLSEIGGSNDEATPGWLILHADLFDATFPIRQKISEHADNTGVEKLIASQKPEGQNAIDRMKVDWALLHDDAGRQTVVDISERGKRIGLQNLDQVDKDFIRRYPDLFPLWKQ